MPELIAVPLTLDAAPRFLFFDADTVLVASVGLVLGIVLKGVGLAIVLMLLLGWGWTRVKSSRGVNRALALAFWHLPLDPFQRVPASARRHFFG